MKKSTNTLLLILSCPLWGIAAVADDASPVEALPDLIRQAGEVKVETHSEDEYQAAATTYRELLEELEALDSAELEGDDAVDADLLERHLRTRLFEIEELRLHQLSPVRYLALGRTDNLFVRPCSLPDKAVADARDELLRLPEILQNGRQNVRRPARTWTENAL